ncbi:MAG: homocysteine S-methyltransferase family protein, partial [Bacteroidales bacterium]|nr:homocysteine S-methyltransferase family protein [Bacteroidales bacterium]
MTSPRYTLLLSQLASRVLLLDGAMGSLIQGYGLSEDDFTGERFKNITPQMKGNNDILNITKPQIIKDIHSRYLTAGCDIIETNTFNGTSISQADYNTQEFVYEMNFQGAKNAREMADKFST